MTATELQNELWMRGLRPSASELRALGGECENVTDLARQGDAAQVEPPIIAVGGSVEVVVHENRPNIVRIGRTIGVEEYAVRGHGPSS
jgi:hypothetical protein